MNFATWLSEQETIGPQNKNIILVNDGSFNPVHRGHIDVTLAAKKFAENNGYHVVGLYMSPKHDNWLKRKFSGKDENIIPAPSRLAMVRKATQETGISVDDWEISSNTFKTGPDYVQHFEQLHPGATFVMILGDDYGNCSPTPCFDQKDNFWHIRMPRTENLSSTRIRKAIKTGEEDVSKFFPSGVHDIFRNLST